MVNTLQTSDVISLVNSAKHRGKHSTIIKILQWELIDNKPKMILQTMNTDKVTNELKSLGYTVKTTSTKKQVTVNYKCDGSISSVKTRNLHTTNLVIKWK